MKKSTLFTIRTVRKYTILLGFSILLTACNNSTSDVNTKTNKEDIAKTKDIIWSIKAIQPEGESLDIKAVDKDGNLFDISAIQNSDQDVFLDVKAFVNKKKLPVKMLVSKDKYAPVKAIDKGGVSYDIKAITPEGEKLDVKGITRSGNVVSLKAINKEGDFYGVKAISPTGQLNDVKGIKINIKEKEMTLNGFNIFAHIKAMHQSKGGDVSEIKGKSRKKNTRKNEKENEVKKTMWNIKAITPDGENLAVKAIDDKGNKFDLKAIQIENQNCFMNIKAFVNGSELPVKVLVSDDKYSPVKAISGDGTIYDIKAIADDGAILDVKGISRSGNIINIKAVNEQGAFYAIKAFSPSGQLNDVKGIKIFERAKELTIQGNEVYAHVKAITH